MKMNAFMTSASRSFHKIGFKFKKHSPEILVVAGVVGTVVSAVMACKATTKVNFVLEETKRKVDIVHDGVEEGEVVTELPTGELAMVPYSEEDGKKDLKYVYAKTALEFVKLYGPAVLLGTVSIASILCGHNILRKRNIAIAAAYTAEHIGFKEYRNRVVERFGEAIDKELKYNIKAKEIEERVVDENGNEAVVKKTVDVIDEFGHSVYAKCFDDTCPGWLRDAERNMFFLQQQQNRANDKLKRQGYLFLNDVYEMLGFQKTKAGQVVGWIYDEEHPIGDNYVDFGIFNIHSKAAREFVNGYEKCIWLDFNVDGDILDML